MRLLLISSAVAPSNPNLISPPVHVPYLYGANVPADCCFNELFGDSNLLQIGNSETLLDAHACLSCPIEAISSNRWFDNEIYYTSNSAEDLSELWQHFLEADTVDKCYYRGETLCLFESSVDVDMRVLTPASIPPPPRHTATASELITEESQAHE